MKRLFQLGLMFLIGTSCLHAEDSSISGRVGGQDKGGSYLGPVASASIQLFDASGAPVSSTTSDENGYYQITGLKKGTYTYKISGAGFSDDDDKRGFQIADGKDSVFDFLLTKPNGATNETGQLSGNVTWSEGTANSPLENVLIVARRLSGGGISKTFTSADGKYSLDLSAGDWRISAFITGYEPQVYGGIVTLGKGISATADFGFSKTVAKAPPQAKEVYALVAVNLKDSGANPGVTPEIFFVATESGNRFESKVKKQDGIGGSEREWFQAEPAAPLATGSYRVEATREGFPLAQTAAKTVYQDLETFYDVELKKKSPEEEIPTKPEEPLIPGISGRVSGQSMKGEFVGMVGGAKIQLVDEAGVNGPATESDVNGYYEISPIKAGKWYYKITAADYMPEDGSRGFQIVPETGLHVHDFVLSKELAQPPATGVIAGTVTKTVDGKTEPLGDTTVTVRREGSGGLNVLKTDSEGKYSVTVPASRWRVSALGGELGMRLHPEVVTVAKESESTVDFSFSKDVIKGETTKDVFALVGVQIGDTGNTGGNPPAVLFVSEPDGISYPVNIKPSSAGDQESGYFEWYHAEAKDPLPVGNYHVTASLEGYQDARSQTKAVTKTDSTTYDANLVPIAIDELSPDPIPPKFTSLNGRVFGQTKDGKFEGLVGGSSISLFNGSGARVYTTVADSAGYYEIAKINTGSYTYRISAPSGSPYEPDNEGRGFTIPSGTISQTHDFLLNRPRNPGPDPNPAPLPGVISGQVLAELDGIKVPLTGASVYAMREGGQSFGSAISDSEGNYSITLPQGSWRLSAMEKDFGRQVHPGLVTLAAGTEQKVDFLFPAPVPPELETDILILTSVQREPTVLGDEPEIEMVGKVDGVETEITDFEVKYLGVNPNSSEIFRELGMEIDVGEEIRHWYAAIPKQKPAPGQYQAFAMLPGYLEGLSQARTATLGSLTILDVDLDRVRPKIDVLVVCSDDKPIEDTSLFFINKTINQSFTDSQKGKTDTLGRFMTELETGLGDYTIMAKASEEFEPRAVQISVNDNRASAKITLFRKSEDKTIDFAGVVVQCNGDFEEGDSRHDRLKDGIDKRVKDATVTVTSKDSGVRVDQLGLPLKTDFKGEIKIPKLPLGSYNVVVKAKGFEDWEGSFDIASIDDMEPEIFAIIGRNTELENWIRMILTQGWGKSASKQYHVNGVKADPEDCNIDYAYGLSQMKSGDLAGASPVLLSSVNKMCRDNFWDRACEAYVWQLMCQKKGVDAAKEIQRIVTTEFNNRPDTESSRETAYVFGLSVGIMKGPWSVGNTNAIRISSEVDQKVVSALNGGLLSEYKRGRDQVMGKFQDLTSNQQDETNRIAQAAAAKKAELEATVGQQIKVLGQQIQDVLNQLRILDDNWKTYERAAQAEINNYKQQRAALANQARTLEATVKAAHCAECSFPHQYGEGQACPQCSYAQELAFQKNQILMGRMQQQDQTLLSNINLASTRYNQEEANYLAARRILEQNDRKYRTDYQRLSGEMSNVPDPTKEINQKIQKYNEEKVSCETYRQFPLEARRQELLDWVNRDGGGSASATTRPGKPVEVASTSPTKTGPVTNGTKGSTPVLAKASSTPSAVDPMANFRSNPSLNRPINLRNPDYSEIQRALALVTNEARIKNGKSQLAISPQLENASQMHAEDMKAGKFFNHYNSRDASKYDPQARAKMHGVAGFVSENINQGYAIQYQPGSSVFPLGNGQFKYPNGAAIPVQTPLTLADSLLTTWMGSDGHRQNILSDGAKAVGCGVVIYTDEKFNGMPSVYAVQNFESSGRATNAPRSSTRSQPKGMIPGRTYSSDRTNQGF